MKKERKEKIRTIFVEDKKTGKNKEYATSTMSYGVPAEYERVRDGNKWVYEEVDPWRHLADGLWIVQREGQSSTRIIPLGEIPKYDVYRAASFYRDYADKICAVVCRICGRGRYSAQELAEELMKVVAEK